MQTTSRPAENSTPEDSSTKIWMSTWQSLAHATPPTVREILHAYTLQGERDRDMLLSVLTAKGAEDQRIAALANLAVLQVQQSLVQMRAGSVNASPAAATATLVDSRGTPESLPREDSARRSVSPSGSTDSDTSANGRSSGPSPILPAMNVPQPSNQPSSSIPFSLPPMRTHPSSSSSSSQQLPQRHQQQAEVSHPRPTNAYRASARSPARPSAVPRVSKPHRVKSRSPPASSVFYPSRRGAATHDESERGQSPGPTSVASLMHGASDDTGEEAPRFTLRPVSMVRGSASGEGEAEGRSSG